MNSTINEIEFHLDEILNLIDKSPCLLDNAKYEIVVIKRLLKQLKNKNEQ